MHPCSARPKYSVSWSNTAHVVEPPGVHSNGLAPQSVSSMPRCSAYQSRRSAASAARWNTPPIPVTRSMIASLRRCAGGRPGRVTGARGTTSDVEIVTERLHLRPFEAADLPAFTAYRSHPDVARYQSWDTTFSIAD